MEIKGKVHCFFEQSGTFKNEFRKLGYEAFDYDIQNEFGETDYVIDLFSEIEKAYAHGPSIFDDITGDDLILAFFPCIYFTFQKYPDFVLRYGKMKNRTLAYQARYAINQAEQRTRFHILLYKLVVVVDEKHLRLVIENPYSSATYLRNNFPPPTLIDRNRMKRGDWFVKPTAYWFFGCEPTYGCSFQNDKKKRTIAATTPSKKAGECSIERSVMSPDYARNWICDFVLGKEQDIEPHLDFGEASA